MTSKPGVSPPRRRPTRDQAVAALLVGTVVVLLGFASGLGLSPTAPTAADAPPSVAASPSSEAGGPASSATATARPPVAYVAEPGPAAAIPGAGTPPPTTAHPNPPAGSSGAPSTPSNPGPRTPPVGSPSPPAPKCSPTIVDQLLTVLLPSPSGSGGGGLLGLDALLGTATHAGTAAALVHAPRAELLKQIDVKRISLNKVRAASTAPGGGALDPTCITDLRQALQLVAAGQDVPTSVAAVTR